MRSGLVLAAFVALLTSLIVSAASAQEPGARATQPPAPRAERADPVLAEASRALSEGRHEDALQLANRYLRAHPRSAAARVLMARAHIERQDLPAAYEQLHHAQRHAPEDVDVLYYLGLVAGRLAVLELERLAEIAPDSARMHQVIAESLEAQQRPHEAAEAYERALARQPDLVDALVGLGRLRRAALRCEEAISLYERAERVRPTYEGAFGLGMCLQLEQQDARAVTYFETATRRDERAALAWQGLGVSLTRLGRSSEAIGHLQRAIELQPRSHEAYYALGQAYRAAGDLEKAKAAFDSAERLQQRRPGEPAPATPGTPR